MTASTRRLRQASFAMALGFLFLGFGLAAVWRDAVSGRAPFVSGPVLPGWSEAAADIARIEIETSNERFSLERIDGVWVMPSRGGYGVQADQIAALDEALGALQFDRAMTRDQEKLDRLGLEDPAIGGNGVRLRAMDAQGAVLADLIVGRARETGGLYLRRASGMRAYGVSGPALSLGDPGRWLGLDFWTHEPSAIARAEITPETGPSWTVMRAGVAQRHYELRAPSDWRLVTAGAGNGVAVAGARLRFRDVKPASALTGEAVARHAAVTFSGLAYEFTFFAEGDERWAVITVAALADDAEPRAAHFRRRVQGWAFAVSPDAYERLTRPLNNVAERGD